MSTTLLERRPAASVCRRRTTCRGCGGRSPEPVLSLGPTPLVNSFLRSPADAADEMRFPLDVYRCPDCTLVQLLDVVDPEVLFQDYIYTTGVSETIATHNAEYARTVVGMLGLSRDDQVVEVASNDGSLLKCFARYGVRTLGVEPAANLAAVAREAGIETVNRFFGSTVAATVRREYGQARAVIGNNVLAHVDDPIDFLRGCRDLLLPGGLVVVEVPHLSEMIDRVEYDTVYHEHLSYFSATALARLFAAAGLALVRIDRVPVHGGSLRVFATRNDAGCGHSPDALAFLDREREWGVDQPERYRGFARAVRENRDKLSGLLESLTAAGKTVAGYGAPAKGNVLLNYCGIDTTLLPFTVDRNPLKVGLYTPGTHIPVLPASALAERQPDYALVLAWNFADEIVRQQAAYRARGGRFIVPIPAPEVLP